MPKRQNTKTTKRLNDKTLNYFDSGGSVHDIGIDESTDWLVDVATISNN